MINAITSAKYYLQIFVISVALLIFFFGVLSVPAAAHDKGKFGSGPDVRLLDNGRDIELLSAFIYIDFAGVKWRAKKGAIANGASIPRPFWTYIGGPLTGKYRNASIIHDYYYTTRERSKKLVDANFYEALLVSGVRKSKAWVMYQAVKWFGDSWTTASPVGCIDGDTVNFEKCIQNSGKKPDLVPGPTVDETSLKRFLIKLEEDGYQSEVNEVRKKVNFSQ